MPMYYKRSSPPSPTRGSGAGKGLSTRKSIIVWASTALMSSPADSASFRSLARARPMDIATSSSGRRVDGVEVTIQHHIATPSSRRRVDGVEAMFSSVGDAPRQFDFYTDRDHPPFPFIRPRVVLQVDLKGRGMVVLTTTLKGFKWNIGCSIPRSCGASLLF